MDAISFEGYKIRQGLMENTQDKIFCENSTFSEEKEQKSGYEIAQESFKLSKLMNEGLSKISDESERKRKNDEYYLLLNLIDILEDKIVKLNGDLEKIYNKMELQDYKEVINLTIPEIQLILHAFWKENQIEWLKEASILHKINPFSIVCKFLANSDFEFFQDKSNGMLYLGGTTYFMELDNFDDYIYIDSFFEEYDDKIRGRFLGFIGRDEEQKCYFNFNNQVFYLLDSYGKQLIAKMSLKHCVQQATRGIFSSDLSFENLSLETKIEMLKEIKKHYEEIEYLETDEMKKIVEFQDFLFKLNCEIILNNLRILHNELSMSYKKLKYEKK